LKSFAEKQYAGKFSDIEISAIKNSKRLEFHKWLQVAHTCVAAVESIKAVEVSQWLQVVHLGVPEFELSKAGEAP
jgi:hypothetical protein